MANPGETASLSEGTSEYSVPRPRSSRASPRPRSAGKKSRGRYPRGKGQGSPYSSTSKNTKTSKELWLQSVNGRTSGSANKGYIGKRDSTEYWGDTLRKSGSGNYTERDKMDTFSGLKKPQTKHMAYASTSHYLRQIAGTEKGKRHAPDSTVKPAPGTPAYKSQEEYYDEIMELKKQMKVLSAENSQMKLKVRRIEEDNIKKEKEIDQLLDPSKSEDMRRTLADRKPDTGTVIHSLKQKILKLEHQLKDKETAYNKLQSDLKTTKIEEMRIQMENFYHEIQRLNQLKNASQDSPRKKNSTVKETPSRLKALQDTILRMNEKNVRLQSENKTLKEDMQNLMDDKDASKETQEKYEDMSKKDLLATITKLEKKLDKADSGTRPMGAQGGSKDKIALEGSMAQKLDQLDKRETELLAELEKQRSIIKRLKDDRTHYRKKAEEKDTEIKKLKKENEDLKTDLGRGHDRGKSGTPRPLPRSQARKRSKSPSVSSSEDRLHRVEEFRKSTAAKHIQREWRQHKSRQDEDEATELIQSALRGHRNRRRNVQDWRRNDERYYSDHMDESDDATDIIQSNLKGHKYRKNMMQNRDVPSPRPRGSRYNNKQLDSEGEEYDGERSYPSKKKSSGYTKSYSGKSSPRYGSTTPSASRKSYSPAPVESDDDDDDDLIVTSYKNNKIF